MAPLRTRSIRFRIAVAFVTALLAMIGAQAYLVAQQGPVRDSLRLVSDGYLPLAKRVALVASDQERVQRDLNRISRDRPRPVTEGTSVAEIYTQELRDNIAEARLMVDSARAMPISAEEAAELAKARAYLDTIEGLFAQYQQQSVTYVSLVDAGRMDEAQETLRKPLRTTSKQLAEEVAKLSRHIDGRITAVSVATERKQTQATAVAVVLATVAVALGLGMLTAVFYALRPIGSLTAQVQRLAAGGVGARVAVDGGDELAVLAREFNAMAVAIEQRDRSLKERADQLNRLSRYLGSVVDSLDDGLIVVDGGLVTLTNPAAARLWQVEVDRPPPESLADLLVPGVQTVEGPGDTLHVVRCVPFGDAGVVAIVADVTDQARAQARLARSERLALVGQMLAQITHEVRNPLNALSLNTELLGDELDKLGATEGDEAWEMLATIAGEVDRLTDVTGHYLQLARRPPARLAPSDVRQLVEDVVRLLEPELEQQGVDLALELPAMSLQLVDDNQLKQALLNVVRNAVESGARHLVLALSHDEDELRLALRDDGPGMTDEELARATDPFWSTKASGTGLGLAITRQILEDHDGLVEIRSTPGQGTTVTLVLPWRPARAPGTERAVTG